MVQYQNTILAITNSKKLDLRIKEQLPKNSYHNYMLNNSNKTVKRF